MNPMHPRFAHRLLLLFALAGVGVTALACASAAPAADTSTDADFGVLLMAHGGRDEWNAAVDDAAAAITERYPTQVAFGMADAASLQQATAALEAEGVTRIGVVRLFVSGESWLERTRQILRLDPGAPERAASPPDGDPEAGHHGGGHHFAAFWGIESSASFAISRDGLSKAPEMGRVLVDRARSLSEEAERESVLILAHGPGDDAENRRWIEAIDARAEAIRQALPLRRVEVMTLREDWPEARERAEARVRAFVEEANQDDGRCLVIPYRVFGFGPYAKVLEGLDYASDGRGLLPHSGVTAWIARQVAELATGEFEQPLTTLEPSPAG